MVRADAPPVVPMPPMAVEHADGPLAARRGHSSRRMAWAVAISLALHALATLPMAHWTADEQLPPPPPGEAQPAVMEVLLSDPTRGAAPDPSVVKRVRELVAEHAKGALEAHDLRMRHAGRLTFLEFHLVVPGGMTVAESHEICDRIEDALRRDMEFLKTTIHVEPEEKAKHQGVLVL